MFRFYFDGNEVENPINWDDFEENIVRDDTIKGLLPRYDIKLQFVGDAYNYLYSLKQQSGYCNLVDLRIDYKCGSNYETILNGYIFISDCKFNRNRCLVECPVTDDNFGARIYNNKNIKTELNTGKSKNGEDITVATEYEVEFFKPSDGTYYATKRKGVFIYDAFRYLIDFMTDGLVGFESDYLDYTQLPLGDVTARNTVVFLGEEIRVPENLVGADTTQLPTPPFGSESPDTTALEFLKKEFNSLIEDGFAAVNIDVTNKVNGQTATETKIDREEFFSLLTKIASELFDLMQNAFDAIGWMRWGNKYQRITVNKPAEFTIRNAESLTSEFKTAMDAKLPSPYLNKVLSENLRVRFSADEQLMKAMEVVSLIDPFVSIDDQTLNLKKSNGLIALWEAVLHDRIYTFIEDELRKDNNFLDKDIEVIKTTLQELAKQKATELTPVRGTAEDILNRI